MNILHTQFNPQKLHLDITDREYLFPQHLTERANQIWDELNVKHTIWNGIVYRLIELSEASDTLTLTLGLTDYKATQSASRMRNEFANMPFSERPNAMYVSGPIVTSDNYYVFSKKHANSIQTNSINFIGGSLNKDEHILTTSADLAETFKKELHEELNIQSSDVVIEKGLGIVETDSFRIAIVFQVDYLNTREHLSTNCILNDEHSELIHVHKDELAAFLKDQDDLLNPLIPTIFSAT
ncbi:NUDIX hydrolase [Candidatus Woesebacteria bacterium]|nr:NUDIX hydrolase [Candidatus Woesebacteria bacterium]